MFKQKFLVKMKFLNSQGEKQDLLNRVENWIEDNLPLLQKNGRKRRTKSAPPDEEMVQKLMKFVENSARAKS